MSKRVLQIFGAMLLVVTIGIVSCQALFAGTDRASGDPAAHAPTHIR